MQHSLCSSAWEHLQQQATVKPGMTRYANFLLLPVPKKLILHPAYCTEPVWRLQCSIACGALLESTNSSRPQSSQV